MLYQDALQQTSICTNDITKPSIPEVLFNIHPRLLFEEINDIYEDCEKLQALVWQEIMMRAQGTKIGQKYAFDKIDSLKTWQEKMPFTSYGDYRELIAENMAEDNEQLFRGKAKMYIATTGSTGNLKYFPESPAGDAAKQLVMAIRGMYMAGLLPVTLDMDAKNMTISNYASLGESGQGKLIVRASGQTARNMRKKTGTMNIMPQEFLEADDLSAEDRNYLMGVYALAEKRFAKIFCNNLYHFSELLRVIKTHSLQMIEDVHTGIFSIELSERTRNSLASTFAANPVRAEELRQIAQKNNNILADTPENIALIWPNLEMTGCWLSATVGRDARETLAMLPKRVQSIDLGYGASEGKFNIPLKLNTPFGAIAPFAMVYEFLSMEDGKCYWAWEVEDGKYYELIITTYSGLYRYRLGDIVQIGGFVGKTPLIKFCGKRAEAFNLNGQTIYGFELSDTIVEVEKALGLRLDLVQFYADNEGYDLIVQHLPEDAAALFAGEAHKACKDEFGVAPRHIYRVSDDYKLSLFRERVRPDRTVCGIKLPMMLAEMPADKILQML